MMIEQQISKLVGDVIDTRTAQIWLEDNGIMYLVYKPGAENNLKDAIHHTTAFRRVNGGKKRPVLVDMRNLVAADRESREYGSGAETACVVSAVAGVTSLLSQVIGNLFISISRPSFPVKLFTSKDEAVEWLGQFVD